MRRLGRLPVRTRLGLISASLTFAILALFAVGVAVFAARQLHGEFDTEVKGTAADLQQRLVQSTLHGPVSTPNAPSLGQPRIGIRDHDDYRVAARPVRSAGGVTVGFFQYGKPRDGVRHTLARIELLLAIGLIGGTLVAFLGGRALARRVMPPIVA